MNQQDFSRKMVVVVRTDLPLWQQVNAVAHCSAYLGNKLTEPFDTGSHFVTKDGVGIPRNSQYGIVALGANRDEVGALADKIRESNLLHIDFVPEMIESGDDAELEGMIGSKTFTELEHVAVGIFGTKEELKALTGHLRLWKGV